MQIALNLILNIKIAPLFTLHSTHVYGLCKKMPPKDGKSLSNCKSSIGIMNYRILTYFKYHFVRPFYFTIVTSKK